MLSPTYHETHSYEDLPSVEEDAGHHQHHQPEDYQGTVSDSTPPPSLTYATLAVGRAAWCSRWLGECLVALPEGCILGSTSPLDPVFSISHKGLSNNSCNSLVTVANSLSFTTCASLVRALDQPSLETG